MTRMALFAQDEWAVTARLQAYLGLRWEGLRTSISGRTLPETGVQGQRARSDCPAAVEAAGVGQGPASPGAVAHLQGAHLAPAGAAPLHHQQWQRADQS
ncbi:TonB-dependent receptor [Massilia sp. H-1]|nr:TonB-dependent receptor [Massilia sp. H-1]